jgi:protein TonB
MAQSPRVEAKPVEPRKEQAASDGLENRVVAIRPAPAPVVSAPVPPRSPARDPGAEAGPSRGPAVPGPVVVARPSEVSRAARPSGGYQVIPSYPATARQQRVEGTTLLKVLVLADGRVGNVAVQKSAGHPALDQAAAEAVRQWHFDPARKGSEPVPMWVLLPVEFHLKDQ